MFALLECRLLASGQRAVSLPPSHFADTFRVLVVPRLRDRIAAQALIVALGHQEYWEADGNIWKIARSLGAEYLPVEHLESLEDWVSTALLEAVFAADRLIDAHEIAVSPMYADLKRWETESFGAG